MTPLHLEAIQTALKGNWEKAVEINSLILKESPEDIDALNRLAFAFTSLGNARKAKHTYQKVLSLDAQNIIALKNLKRLSTTDAKKMSGSSPISMNNIFIEEPGKTKVIELINIADQKRLSKLLCGEMLSLQVKRMKIFLLNTDQEYAGMLPDDLSKRLIKFMKGGNKYEAFVKTVNNHKLTVLLREIKRSPRLKNQPSFVQSDKTKLVLDGSPKRHEKDAKKAGVLPETDEDGHDGKAYSFEDEVSG